MESEGAKIFFRNVRIMELPPGVTSPEQTAPEANEATQLCQCIGRRDDGVRGGIGTPKTRSSNWFISTCARIAGGPDHPIPRNVFLPRPNARVSDLSVFSAR